MDKEIRQSEKITKAPIPSTIRPQRMIGEFYADVTIKESAIDTLEITQHPVQQGASITDHAYLKPTTLNLTVAFGCSESHSLEEIYSKLLRLQESRIPINVVTGKRIFKNMLIQSLSQTTESNNENILLIDFSLQEIILTAVEVVTVPSMERQRYPRRTEQRRNSGTCNKEELSQDQGTVVSNIVINNAETTVYNNSTTTQVVAPQISDVY